MNCLYCQKRIGVIRRVTDREFCSDAHRRNMRSLSARVARTMEYETVDEVWPVYVKPASRGASSKAPDSTLASTALFGSLIVLALVIGSFGVSGDAAAARNSAGPVDDFRRMVRDRAAVKLNDDFKGGMSTWTGLSARGSAPASRRHGLEWSKVNGFIRPGNLRLWKDSLAMSDYQMEFVGQIEKKALSWAFRAKDLDNYYATKIAIVKPGPLPTADFVRYAVTNGIESSKVSMPLPLQVRNDTLYRIQLNVKGNFFSTTVNGQIVDSWTDKRHPSGGVGFFSEPGEIASLRWVSVSSRTSFVGQILSYFGFWTPYLLLPNGL
ncbi:MAG TPA: hypothetical protein VMZ52_13485 [Bryobacteraceae bacterium]|nr:hypothetical protein [Bryobacteraceae bacterium]